MGADCVSHGENSACIGSVISKAWREFDDVFTNDSIVSYIGFAHVFGASIVGV